MEGKEEILLEVYPLPVSIEKTNKRIQQLKNTICKIYTNEGGKGTGFFVKIKYNDSNKFLPVLITNNHVLNENNIKPNQTIKISFYEKIQNEKNEILYKEIYKDINIGEDRLVYTSEEYDTTIIEIKKEKDKIYEFLELDSRIFQYNSNVFFYGTSVYLLQ